MAGLMKETGAMRQAGEPSVEEILESIKKVIARDSRIEAAQMRAQRETVGASPQGARGARADEILELTDPAATSQAAPETGSHDQADGRGDADADDSAAPGAMPPLVAEEAVSSMRGSLAALALLAEPGAAPQIVRSGETSLEGLTRELLRPMLAQWLDQHLPAMVERLVAAEIARIAGKKR
jgi:cell pole-organizing protein PopZ